MLRTRIGYVFMAVSIAAGFLALVAFVAGGWLAANAFVVDATVRG
jgi:hypothetical protein